MNGLVTLFSEPWVERLGWVLIHFLWQGTGIALLLAVALRLLARASSHVRYVVIGGALLLCGVMPLATWMMLGSQTEPSAPSLVAPTLADVPKVEAPAALSLSLHPDAVIESPGNAAIRWLDNLSRLADASLPYVVCLWFVGVLILTLRLTLGWTLMRRLCRSGLPIQDSLCPERFRSLLERMQVGVPVRLLQSALVEVPTLIGWLRPTILVPASVFIGLSPDQLEAILAHELAHVRRYDYLVNLFQTVIETILFYHPAIWWISRKLREERENCCDDIALEIMQDRLVYASALAQLEEGRTLPLALTASGGSLLQRIRRIADANDRKVSALPWGIMILILIIVVGLSIRTTRADAPTVAITPKSDDSTPTSLPTSDVKITISLSGKLKDWTHLKTSPDGSIEVPTVSQINLVTRGLKFGETGNIESIHYCPYPDEFNEPATLKPTPDSPSTTVIPITPAEFVRSRSIGWGINVSASKGENGIVHLKGIASYTTYTLKDRGAYGENSGPIYSDLKNPQTGKVEHVLLTPNNSWMPVFQTSETPFFVFAKPSQAYVIKLQEGADSVEATIRCDLIAKPDKSSAPKTTDASNPTGTAATGNFWIASMHKAAARISDCSYKPCTLLVEGSVRSVFWASPDLADSEGKDLVLLLS